MPSYEDAVIAQSRSVNPDQCLSRYFWPRTQLNTDGELNSEALSIISIAFSAIKATACSAAAAV